MSVIYMTGIVAILVILIVAIFANRKARKDRDLRFDCEYCYLECFVKNSKVNRASYEAILEWMSKIVISGKPQIRKMLKLRNDFKDKFKNYINEL